jgi:RNA polymerase sigma-70 factor, ECF subfamily
LKAVRSRRRFRGVENPVAYLFQIARNEAMRSGSRRRKNERPLEAADLRAASATTGQWDDADLVAAALAKLGDEDREIVELKSFAGLTFREIADVLSEPLATVATRYRRALESLRPWLEKQFR